MHTRNAHRQISAAKCVAHKMSMKFHAAASIINQIILNDGSFMSSDLTSPISIHAGLDDALYISVLILATSLKFSSNHIEANPHYMLIKYCIMGLIF